MTYQTTIQVEAMQWTGDNFEEVKSLCPKVFKPINTNKNRLLFREGDRK